jgi:hypothetical protein
MMAAAAGWLTKLGGSGLLLPAALLALCVSLYQQYGARQDKAEDRIEQQATQACNLSWELAHAKRQQTDAQLELQATREQMEAERDINTGLANELSKISSDYEGLRSQMAAAPSLDPERCLSDSVLNRLRGPGTGGVLGGEGQGAAGQGRQGSGKR